MQPRPQWCRQVQPSMHPFWLGALGVMGRGPPWQRPGPKYPRGSAEFQALLPIAIDHLPHCDGQLSSPGAPPSSLAGAQV